MRHGGSPFHAVAVVGVLLVTRSAGPPVPTAEAAPGVEHVHGLGVDPADGVLYAATHTGLFRVPDTGKATRVADRFQDTMGFTVVGPNHFLGSGHPDINERKLRRSGLPPLLGLIESTDAADTWEPRSELGLASFAVNPRDPDKIAAATGDGLILSSDGGRSWQPTDGPALVFVAWNEDSGVWGLDPGGQMFNDASGLGSGPWTRVAELEARPEALLVRGSEIYAAVMSDDATEIRHSTDGGQTWKVRYRDGRP